jgi:hypothetical protein
MVVTGWHRDHAVMVSSKATFRRDLGLQVRMLLTMALLGLLYVVFVVVLLAAGVGTALMLVIVGGLALAQLFLSAGCSRLSGVWGARIFLFSRSPPK